MSWEVTRLTVQGIKGVLARAGDFDLTGRKSIAIFAPNGCGKSGYADAIEYLFSEDGTVEHLGKGPADSEHGGKHAIPHVLAAERGISSEVTIRLRESATGQTLTATRPVITGRNDPLPAVLGPILATAPAHRILRQHDLRRFVVDMPPRDKYSEVARWLGLSRLELVLRHLTTTAQTLEKTDLDREIDERLKDVAKHTNGVVTTHDEPAVLAWCAAEASKFLRRPVSLNAATDLDMCAVALAEHRDSIVLQSQAATARQKAKASMESLDRELLSETGSLQICDTALSAAKAADDEERRHRDEAKESAFQEIWTAAAKVLSVEQPKECPVCQTPWQETRAGSQKAALIRLNTSLESLAALARTQSAHKKALQNLSQGVKKLVTKLDELGAAAQGLSLADIAQTAGQLTADLQALVDGDLEPVVLRARCESLVKDCRAFVADKVQPAAEKLDVGVLPTPAADIDALISQVRGVKQALLRLTELQRERTEYRRVEQGFATVQSAIQSRAAKLVDAVVSALRERVQAIYSKIHPYGVVPRIYITPDTEAKTLQLRVDFHSSQRTVPPAGYLSEAQINTLGMALFISSVQLFNREFPFLVLDDIVSSYDADHRVRILDVIAEDLQGCQVFLTTHDERFYSMLRSRLTGPQWIFDRITGWELEQGPRRESDALRPRQIEALIKSGNVEAAGNAVRQYIEEWFDDMCARYVAYTPHKRPPEEFKRSLFDFWEPFIDRLKTIKGGFFKQRVEPQLCYKRLRARGILNYYSHAQANPYEWPAIGDVAYVWENFQQFQSLFCCAACSKALKFDHDAHALYCTCGGKIVV